MDSENEAQQKSNEFLENLKNHNFFDSNYNEYNYNEYIKQNYLNEENDIKSNQPIEPETCTKSE